MSYKEINWDQKNEDEIYEFYTVLPREDKYPFLKWVQLHYNRNELEWIEMFRNLRNEMNFADYMALCEDFASWVPQQYPELYAAMCEDIERDLCAYYLFKQNFPKFREHVNYVSRHPVQGIDVITIKLYFQLLYHGHYEEALRYAEAVHKPLKDSEDTINNPESVFVSGIYFNALEHVYQAFKESGQVELSEFNKVLSDLQLKQADHFVSLEVSALQAAGIPEDLVSRFEFQYVDCLIELKIHFLKYIRDRYTLPFILSHELWDLVSVKDLFGQSELTESFFYVSSNTCKQRLNNWVDHIFRSNDLEIFGKVWGMHLIYEFLEAEKLISGEAAERMRENIHHFQGAIMRYASGELWQMAFVCNWPGNHGWKDLKPVFENTFSKDYHEIDTIVREYQNTYPVSDRIKKELETEERNRRREELLVCGEPYVKTEPDIGRNDPCPCGSGKKYKKCCMNKA